MVSKIQPSSKSLDSMDRAARAARVWAFPWATQGQGLPPLEAVGKMTTSDDSIGFPSHLARFLGPQEVLGQQQSPYLPYPTSSGDHFHTKWCIEGDGCRRLCQEEEASLA